MINPEFQGKFLAIFAIFGFFQAFVNYYAIYFAFKQIRYAVTSGTKAPDQEIIDLIGMQEFYVVSFIGIAFAISFLVFIFVGIRFTHHAAGALYRFKQEFSSMRDNKDLHHVKLREGDFFRDVEQAFNELVDEVKPSK